MHVMLNYESLEEVDFFKYLRSQAGGDGGCKRDVVHRVNEGWGALKSVLHNRGLGIKAKKCLGLHIRIVIIPTALYGAEAWRMRSAERRKVNVLQVKCLRSLVGVSRLDKEGRGAYES